MKNQGWFYLVSILFLIVLLITTLIGFTPGSYLQASITASSTTNALLDCVARVSSIGLVLEGLLIVVFVLHDVTFNHRLPGKPDVVIVPGSHTRDTQQ